MSNKPKHKPIKIFFITVKILYSLTVLALLIFLAGVTSQNYLRNIEHAQLLNTQAEKIIKQNKEISDWQIQFARKVLPPEPTPSPLTNNERKTGNTQARFALLVYNDMECPYCKAAYSIEKSFIEKNANEIFLVYRHFPLDSIHPNAFKYATILECAYQQQQDKGYFNAVDTIFNSTSIATLDDVSIANLLNLDSGKLTSCLNDQNISGIVREQQLEAQNAGINGTPTAFFVDTETGKIQKLNGILNNNQLEQEFESFKNATSE